jgi:DNA replication and repair protein RecF
MEFEPGINAVIGDNGQGKTNLLEALFFLLTERPARTNDISELIEHGEEEARVEGTFNVGREIVKRIVIDRDGRVRKRGETEEIGTALFQPDDIWMVKGGPEARRRNLDAATMEIKKGYRDILREYQRALKQRNEAIRAVRKGMGGRETLRNWNPLLYRYGSAIVKERTKTAKGLESEMKRLAEKWEKGNLNVKYYTSMGDAVDNEIKTMEKIEKMEEAEIRRGTSLMGPHRDELLIHLDGKNVRRECSQGEQKLVTIMWRLAQARRLREQTGKRVLLLMDDCLSELDEENRAHLMGELGEWEQAMITSTDDMPEFEGANKVLLRSEAAT